MPAFVRPLLARALVGLALAAVQALAQASATATLENITLPQGQGETRVVLRFSRVPSFHDFALGGPPRAVLDMDNTRDDHPAGDLSGGAVRDLRMARHRDGTLRAVLDLRPGAHLAGVKRRGHTLVARLTGGGAAQVTASQGRPAAASAAAPAQSAKIRPAGYQAPPRRGPVVVVIDPGHGGKDPGTTGPDGLHEKTVVLAIAKMVYAKLAKTPGVHPVLSRRRLRRARRAIRFARAIPYPASLPVTASARIGSRQ